MHADHVRHASSTRSFATAVEDDEVDDNALDRAW